MDMEAPPPSGSISQMPVHEQARWLGFYRARQILHHPGLMKAYQAEAKAKKRRKQLAWLAKKKAEHMARMEARNAG